MPFKSVGYPLHTGVLKKLHGHSTSQVQKHATERCRGRGSTESELSPQWLLEGSSCRCAPGVRGIFSERIGGAVQLQTFAQLCIKRKVTHSCAKTPAGRVTHSLLDSIPPQQRSIVIVVIVKGASLA